MKCPGSHTTPIRELFFPHPSLFTFARCVANLFSLLWVPLNCSCTLSGIKMSDLIGWVHILSWMRLLHRNLVVVNIVYLISFVFSTPFLCQNYIFQLNSIDSVKNGRRFKCASSRCSTWRRRRQFVSDRCSYWWAPKWRSSTSPEFHSKTVNHRIGSWPGTYSQRAYPISYR